MAKKMTRAETVAKELLDAVKANAPVVAEVAAEIVAPKPADVQHEMKIPVPGTAERLAELEIKFNVLSKMLGVTFKKDGDRYIAVK